MADIQDKEVIDFRKPVNKNITIGQVFALAFIGFGLYSWFNLYSHCSNSADERKREQAEDNRLEREYYKECIGSAAPLSEQDKSNCSMVASLKLATKKLNDSNKERINKLEAE